MANLDTLSKRHEAINKMQESVRDLTKVTITLPLGNPDLKLVHTNQFLFTKLPPEFALMNLGPLMEALNGNLNRNSGFVENRWYIENIVINNDGDKGTMEITVNPAASSQQQYITANNKFNQDYLSAANSNTESTSDKKTKTKTKTKTKKNGELFASKAGGNVSSDLGKAVQQICEGAETEEQKAYCIFTWVDKYVHYSFYYDFKYSSSTVLKNKVANCGDSAMLIYNLCTKAKVRCKMLLGTYRFRDGTYGHYWNEIPYKGKMTFADAGRSSRMGAPGNHNGGHILNTRRVVHKNY